MPKMDHKTSDEELSLETIAYKEIKQAITSGIFPRSYQIVEEHISGQLNMSRSPVRSAIKRLQAEGYLERRDNKRIYVASPDTSEIIDILYVREALDGMTARLAAVHRTDRDVEIINDILAQTKVLMKSNNLAQLHELTIQIHHAIYGASKSRHLSALAKTAESQVSLFTYHSLKLDDTRSEAAYAEHALIAQYVIEQKPDEAEKAARYHIAQLRDRVILVESMRNQTASLTQSSLRA